ncbi:MAG: winged helix DNA-binding domain-containing protein [Acidimicrobiia bacterium]|nr:winged helix DNA-binding domain-containing protein [Acidimicrobiia bacterium]
MRRLTSDQASRLALGAQGFGSPRPEGRVDVRHFRRILEINSVVQLDSVNVAARAHYMPFFSRLGPYDRSKLDDWLWSSRENFEYWGHVASVMPMRVHRLLRHRMNEVRPWRFIRELAAEHPGFVDEVRAAVEARGPLSVSDLENAGSFGGSWWGWKPGRTVLEWLYITGELAVDRRDPQFKIYYDLHERVIPAAILDERAADRDEAHRELILLGARAQGVGTATDLADQFRLKGPEVRRAIGSLVESGRLEEADVEGWKQRAYLDPATAIPRSVEGGALLSPFDPVVWKRDRAERLFGFEYRIEIYVPKEKRQFGYYVLPFLLDGRLQARVDVKADRQGGRLIAQAAHVEEGCDPVRVGRELARELETMAGWLELDDVSVVANGELSSHL